MTLTPPRRRLLPAGAFRLLVVAALVGVCGFQTLAAEELSDPATSVAPVLETVAPAEVPSDASTATVESAPVTLAEPLATDTEPVLELAAPDPEATEATPRSAAPFQPPTKAPVAVVTRTDDVATAAAVETPAGLCIDPQGFLTERGLASWYGDEFAGRLTASGETYDPAGLSVAHLTFPFGALVEVRNLDNGRRILARVNDRGPYVQNRIIDCSLGAAYALGFVGHGVARVSVKLLDAQADVSLIAARRPPALVEDAASPVPSAHAFADRLALGSMSPGGRAVVVAHAAQSRPESFENLELRRASVLPFPILVHASQWIFNAILGPRGEEGTAHQRRQLLDATGLRSILRFCLR